MGKVLDALNEVYAGREFMYKSKYGGFTKCVCESIVSSYNVQMDEDTTNVLKYHIDHSVKGTKTMDLPEMKGTPKWIAANEVFSVISTVGNVYEWDECYFLGETV